MYIHMRWYAERPDVILLEGWMLGFEALPDQQQQLTEGEAEEAEVLRGCPELRVRGIY